MSIRTLHCPDNNTHRLPWYFITIISFFILPISFLIKYTKNIEYAAFFKTVGVIMALGYSWSYLVTSNGWWVFNPQTMLGIEILPNLPLEEVLFYPLGGALSILTYLAISQYFHDTQKAAKGYLVSLCFLTLIASCAVVISIREFGKIPIYILSQMVLYNSLSIGLWFVGNKRVVVKSAWFAVMVMTIIGFFWNWIAFSQTWWTYHATLGWMVPPHVPVDDWNFFVFAPLSAMSLYECFRRKG